MPQRFPMKLNDMAVRKAKPYKMADGGGMCLEVMPSGLAYTGMYRQGHYIVSTAGESHKSPTFTIGAVVVLVVLLYKLIKMVISRQGGMPK